MGETLPETAVVSSVRTTRQKRILGFLTEAATGKPEMHGFSTKKTKQPAERHNALRP